MGSVHVINHSAAAVLLTSARERETPPKDFADAMRRLGYILAVEVVRELRTKDRVVTTPLNMIVTGEQFDGRVALVPVLRAGGVLEEGFRTMLVNPHVWHYGLRRDELTLLPIEYLNKVPAHPPKNLQSVIILEVMFATGGSAIATIEMLKARGYKNITFVCVLAAPEGIESLQTAHPDVDIYVVAIDERLTGEGDTFPKGYIVPGLGDAGDRINDTLGESELDDEA